MEDKSLPLVSVPVITYNSSKTVIETLDSIYNQNYPNIELIVSDDHSLDNTVELANEWIKVHKDRFARVELLTVEKNTGTASNLNRAEDACQGTYVKSIAGDDLLLADCIKESVDYATCSNDFVLLFCRMMAFGAREEICEEINSRFDYSKFYLSNEEQLHSLLFDTNFIPGPTIFYHRDRFRATGVVNDPRIPMLEDWPKWINLLRKGVKLHFIDKTLVKYRVGGVSTSNVLNSKMFMAERLFRYYYQYPAWQAENEEMAVQRMVEDDNEIYQMLIDSEKRYHDILNSKAYSLGKFILKPLKLFRR